MPTCYFTYSWENDIERDKNLNLLLSYMRNQIETLSDHSIKVVYDKECFEEGKNFRELEKQIKDSDSILLFFTPDYKNKVENQDNDLDCGARREYQMIKERAMSEVDGIIPILLSGTKDSAVTEEFKDIIHWDISKTNHQVYKANGKTILGKELELIVKKIVRKAIREANAVSYCKEHTFISVDEEYRALFLDSDVTPLPKSCLIRTSAHDKVISQNACIVIGRNGSGKSTLLNSIQKYDPKYFRDNYKELKSMDIESLDINFIYTCLIEQTRKEFNLISMPKIIDTFWEIVFVLQGMITLGYDLENLEIDPEDNRYRVFNTMTNKLKKLFGLSTRRKLHTSLKEYSTCHCAVELIANHINDNGMLTYASEETPYTAAYNNVNAYTILCKVFGKTDFDRYCAGIKQCSKKIFFALDGFDTHSEDFRATTTLLFETNYNEYLRRKDFEIKLFRELLVSVSNVRVRTQQPAMQDFFASLHFCVILPQDRYDEIALHDRDIAKRNYCTLNWDAYDLLEMLVKRLEYYYRMDITENIPLNMRFNNIIETQMPSIPTEISVLIDGFERKIPLFNYLLRLSFWRPRDIIKNFAMVIKLSKDENEISGYSENVLKKFLIRGAKNIIEDEFINEYKNVYLNIKDVLYKFRETNLIQGYNEFCTKLSKIKI